SVTMFSSSSILNFYPSLFSYFFFFFTDPATPEIYTLSLHDALPISVDIPPGDRLLDELQALLLHLRQHAAGGQEIIPLVGEDGRSEEHTSELQSRGHLVCRLLLEKKKKNKNQHSRAEEGQGNQSGNP